VLRRSKKPVLVLPRSYLETCFDAD
jgi:hypothetical protein